MTVDQSLPFAVVILAGRAGAGDADRIAEMVLTARDVGAHAIVVAVPRGWRAPAHARVVHVAPRAAPIAAVRAGMAQLSNTPARHALLWPLDAWAVTADRLGELVETAQREPSALTALEGDDVEHAPVMIARDAWLELMTLGEQGIGVVAARLGLRRVSPDRTT